MQDEHNPDCEREAAEAAIARWTEDELIDELARRTKAVGGAMLYSRRWPAKNRPGSDRRLFWCGCDATCVGLAEIAKVMTRNEALNGLVDLNEEQDDAEDEQEGD